MSLFSQQARLDLSHLSTFAFLSNSDLNHKPSTPNTVDRSYEGHHCPRLRCRIDQPSVSTTTLGQRLSLIDHSNASPIQPTCTKTLPAPVFDAYSFSTTVTKTVHTACHGCALVTAHGGPTPDIMIPTTGTQTTTITICKAGKKPNKSSSASPSPTTTTFLGTLPGDDVPSDCTFSTLIPFTLSVPTCYGHYVTSTQGIDCQGCGTYTNIAGHGPLKKCGVTAPAATGTSTVLACTS